MLSVAERVSLRFEHEMVLAAEEALEAWRSALKGNAFTVDDGVTVETVAGSGETSYALSIHKGGRSQEVQVVLDDNGAGVLARRRHVNEDASVPVDVQVHGRSQDARALRDALRGVPNGLVVADANRTI